MLKEFMCLSKLINLIYLIIIMAMVIVALYFSYERGLRDATKSSETASDILTINARSVYVSVDGEKEFKIVVGEGGEKDDK